VKEGALVLKSQLIGAGIRLTVAYSVDGKGHLLVDASLKPARGKAVQRRRVYKR
jgi:hypothetical protein